MPNDLIAFETLPVPAHIATAFAGEETNLHNAGMTVPSVTFIGKVWSISVDGAKQQLMRTDADGEQAPISVFKVVILDYNAQRGRAYYEGAYDPAQVSQPICWSNDGKKPDPSIATPQALTCASCPKAVKGSRMTDSNKPTVACTEHRLLVVVPAQKLDFEPLRMKIAITSDWDGQSPDLQAQGWFAFSNYIDFLKNRVHAMHSAAVVTKMKFDPSVAYPKIIFAPDRWLTADEVAIVQPVSKSEKIKTLLSREWTPAGADGVPTATPAQPTPQQQVSHAIPPAVQHPAPLAAQVIPQPAAPSQQISPQPVAAPAIQPVTPAVQSAKPAPVVIDDDGDVPLVLQGTAPAAPTSQTPAAPAPAKPAPVAKAVPANVSDDLAALLSEWGDK